MDNPNANQNNDITRRLSLGGESGGRKKIRRYLTWGLFVVVLVIAAVAWMRRSKTDGLQFKTQEAVRGDLTVTVSATGTLAPTNQVEVGSELSGIVETVKVDYNDRVSVGQPLARLDNTKFDAEVMKSRAALASAESNLQQTRATLLEKQQNLNRLRETWRLTGGKAPSPYDLEAAEAALERARADIASAQAGIQGAQANLTSAETDLAKTVIYSPVNGIVLSRTIEPGQTVAASFQAPVLFTLAEDLTKMELQVDVDEADVGQVREGQEATFMVDAYPDRIFKAHITQVRYGSQTTEGVVTYKTLLKVDNPDLALRPGMTATAEITVKRLENALLVPNAALRFSPPQDARQPESRGLVGVLLPHPPRRDARSNGQAEDFGKNQRVWILRKGSPVPILVTTSATDGTFTAITGGELEPGTALLVDTVRVGT